jgi:hypothetical protein
MGLTIRQIIKAAGPTRRQASAYVDIKKTSIKKTAQGWPLVLCKTSSNVTAQGKSKPGGSANTYVTTIAVGPKKQVIVSCSCDDFKFTWEYALNKKGAALIEYSNGEHPEEKNPGLQAGACKHVVAVGQMLIDKGKL